MSESATPQSPGNRVSFASLIASLAGGEKPEEPWDTSDLADDVATISYQCALRTDPRAREPESVAAPSLAVRSGDGNLQKEQRKSASITLRITEQEQAKLHARAREAGLSVSAYLRSCIFEVESLRTQVKETLSQMRAIQVHEPGGSDSAENASERRRRFRFLSRWTRGRRIDA